MEPKKFWLYDGMGIDEFTCMPVLGHPYNDLLKEFIGLLQKNEIPVDEYGGFPNEYCEQVKRLLSQAGWVEEYIAFGP